MYIYIILGSLEIFYYSYCYYLLETGFVCVALAILELVLYTRLASNSDLCLQALRLKV